MTSHNEKSRCKELKAELDTRREKLKDLKENGPDDNVFYADDCEYIDEVLAEIAAEEKEIEVLERELALEEEHEAQLHAAEEEEEEIEEEEQEKIIIKEMQEDAVKMAQLYSHLAALLDDDLTKMMAYLKDLDSTSDADVDLRKRAADLLNSQLILNKELGIVPAAVYPSKFLSGASIPGLYSPFRFFPKLQSRLMKELEEEESLHHRKKY